MLSDLAFRPVRAEDKPRVLEFTARTWGEDDSDYIQYVFDDWLADPKGEFTAAIWDGEVAGIAKLTEVAAGQWWFEGLRVDPAHRRKGIGERLNRYQVDLARRLGGHVIRYMTGGENLASQTIGLKAGFQHILTFIVYEADATTEPSPLMQLDRSHLPALRDWLHSRLLSYTHQLYRDDWSVCVLDEAELRSMLESGQTYGLLDRSGRLAAYACLRADDEGNSDRLRIGHIDGEPEAITRLALGLRALAGARQKQRLRIGVVDYPPLLEAITQAGFQPDEDHFQLWVMELEL